MRTDASALNVARSLLLAPETASELRMALALILGTLNGNDAVLIEALGLFRAEIDVTRCILFALGATREPLDDDDVFGMGDRPWGEHGPGGLGITVNRLISSDHVRTALAGFLRDERGPAREAAATALRHSTTLASCANSSTRFWPRTRR